MPICIIGVNFEELCVGFVTMTSIFYKGFNFRGKFAKKNSPFVFKTSCTSENQDRELTMEIMRRQESVKM